MKLKEFTGEQVAKQLYDVSCLDKAKRMGKQSARDISCEFDALYEQAKEHYRAMAAWVVELMEGL